MGLDNPLHIAFLLVVLLLVFGARRLPEMGRSLGSGMRGFKDALSGEDTPATLAELSPPAGSPPLAASSPLSASPPVEQPLQTTARRAA